MPVVPPRNNELYREHLTFPLMKLVFALQMLLGLFFLGMTVFQSFSGTEGDNPPLFVSLILAVVFLGVAWLVSNFIRFDVAITPDAINLEFGRFRTVVWFEDIESFERDSRSRLVYGGWGLRITLLKDGWAKAYTMIGKPKIDLKLKKGRYRHIIFSTDHPDEVMVILVERLKNAAGHVRSPF